jgi:glycosyl hydrolase family 42 (putative beta-galactosidase)
MSDDAFGPTPSPWPVPGLALDCEHHPEEWPESVWTEFARLAGAETIAEDVDGPHRSYLFVLNHSDVTATISASGYDPVSQQETTGTLTVEPGGSAVVREAD